MKEDTNIILEQIVDKKARELSLEQLFNIPRAHLHDLLVPLTMLKTGIWQSDTAIKYLKELRENGYVDNSDYNLW